MNLWRSRTPPRRPLEECRGTRLCIHMDQARFRLSTPRFRSAWLVRLTLRKPRHYFQGVGGSGAPPFFQGVGGSGAPPFFHGVGGSGAPPFAMITEPSPWVTTTVLRLIAPTKTSMASRITVSLRDIVPPGQGITPERVYISAQQCQAG